MRQTKNEHCVRHFYEVPRIGKFPETGSRTEVTKGTPAAGSECGELVFKADGVPVWDDEKVLEMDRAM